MKKRTTGLAGKIAVLCMVAMIAAGGAYTWRQSNTAVPELTTFVDHDADSVVIGEEEVPFGGKTEVKKETRKSKKLRRKPIRRKVRKPELPQKQNRMEITRS